MATTHLHGNTIAVTRGKDSTGLWALMSTAAHDPLMRHAPHGKAWPRESASWFSQVGKAASYSFARIYRRVQDLLREYSPRFAVELLTDWERDWGVVAAGTTADRQAAVVAKINGLGESPSSAPTLVQLAQSLGYVNVKVQTYDPLVTGDDAGDLTFDETWRYRTDLISYTRGPTIDAALKAALALRSHAYAILGMLDAWRSWVVTTSPSMTVQSGFATSVYPGFVIVGNSAQVWYSPDGTIWNSITPAAGYVGPFVGGMELPVAGGSLGTLLLLGQGEIQYKTTVMGTFSRVSVTGNPAAVASRVSVNNQVAVGDSGRIWFSAGGTSWVAGTPAASYTGQFYDVAWNEVRGVFMAVGANGELQEASNSSGPWTRKATGSGTYSRITVLPDGSAIITNYGVGYTRVSSTGVVTTGLTIPGFSTVADIQISSDGKTLIASGGQIYTSNDGGATWDQRNSGPIDAGRIIMGPAANPIAIAPSIGSPTSSLLRGSYNGIENAI